VKYIINFGVSLSTINKYMDLDDIRYHKDDIDYSIYVYSSVGKVKASPEKKCTFYTSTFPG